MSCNPLSGCLQRIALPNVNATALGVEMVNKIHGELCWVILNAPLLADLLVAIPQVQNGHSDRIGEVKHLNDRAAPVGRFRLETSWQIHLLDPAQLVGGQLSDGIQDELLEQQVHRVLFVSWMVEYIHACEVA